MRYLFIKSTAICLVQMCAVTGFAQRDKGNEILDTVQVSLKPGAVIGTKYVPFDVPFHVTGDAKNIESVRLKIIDDAYQACEGDGYDLFDKDDELADCDCDCKSIYDKRLEFFRMVRSVHTGEITRLAKKLDTLRIIRGEMDMLLRELDKSKWLVPDDKKDVSYFAPETRKKIDDALHSICYACKGAAPRDMTRDVGRYAVRLKEENTALAEKLQLRDLVSKVEAYLNGQDKTKNSAIRVSIQLNGATLQASNLISELQADSSRLSRFVKHQVGLLAYNEIYSVMGSISEFEAAINGYIAAHQNMVEKTKGRRWKDLTGKYQEMIKMDSLMFCPSCDFDGRRCNAICPWPWEQNEIQGKSDAFLLPIPPLEPDREYLFFFEVTRRMDDGEKDKLHFFLSKSIVQRIDSVIENMIRGYDPTTAKEFDELRSNYLSDQNYPLLDIRIVKEAISGYLKLEFGSQLKSEIILIDRIQDQQTRKNLLDKIILNRFYLMQLDKYYKRNEEAPDVYTLLVGDGTLLRDSKRRFLEAGQLDKYKMFETLLDIAGANRGNSLQRVPLLYQNIKRDVPTGLIPYDNLQKIGLRKLDEVNDFDTATANEYIRSLQQYEAYLLQIQAFIRDEVIVGAGKRRKLFADTPNPISTRRELTARDNRLKGQFSALYDSLDSHRNDIQRVGNVYENYRDNVLRINDQSSKLVDSLLNNNRNIQLATARNTGGFTSGDFETRTKWRVTADVGIALLTSKTVGASVTPYFGANFNFHPINRNAFYGLLAKSHKKRYLLYDEVSEKALLHKCPFWRRMWKGASFVLGVTVANLQEDGKRENLISNGGANLNLLTGAGIRLTDAARLSMGTIWTKDVNPSPLIDSERVRANFYISLSFDVDVVSALGELGTLLSPK
ncbi:hypothetical protein [Parachryseolinea silvisoli]|uniref:hypothetical protein n=1 Tax=Parachryseolinea silvisoli TaxID=2873601 RepID=UPI002265F9FA|nr:hypothetical protein [Parachryseolinea silvisoli]MCD9018776.1 hypothetical protein [Parachryseolinea silvisoli]